MQDTRQIAAAFRADFLRGFSDRLVRSHQRGNSLSDIATLLNPIDLIMSLAEGADRVSSKYHSNISERTMQAMEKFIETSQYEARDLLPEWIDICNTLNTISSKTMLGRLTSIEADIGDNIGELVLRTTSVSESGRTLLVGFWRTRQECNRAWQFGQPS